MAPVTSTFLVPFLLLNLGLSVALPIQLLIALPAEDATKLSKGLQRTIDDLEDGMNASVVLIPEDVTGIIDVMCEEIENSGPHVVLSFLPNQRTFYVNMVAGQVGLPALTLTRDYTDLALKVNTTISGFFSMDYRCIYRSVFVV
ncbi:hypothetical protein JTE90_004907 [Oedothorax gibbosus]|uniref:Receptor ligand binding region domain-containing protein n=1 Tax=Oedothorax gibbosus TaxID=931172 RepID=A0AAV6UGH5_9ARAC|nr:hypothetical protein JTE90_004907 [Oedothorax gibbosus]